MKYFELGLGDSIEDVSEDFDYTFCIRGIREPQSLEEAQNFIQDDMNMLGYKAVVSIKEITEYEAKHFFDWDSIDKAKIFGE